MQIPNASNFHVRIFPMLNDKSQNLLERMTIKCVYVYTM